MDHSERKLCFNIFTVDLVFLYGIMFSTLGLRHARVLSRICCLGEKSWVAEGIELPRGIPGQAAPEIIWNEYALRWCILRHNSEKCYSVCNGLVASGWFFQYSYLQYTVMITNFLEGKLDILGGESFYPSNTLDGTLHAGHCRGV